ncbi:MAG: rod-binding protein [Defluviitaleaceae bacterium]|nr:rod-binding protein [Defluviitaleaceae bacterium]
MNIQGINNFNNLNITNIGLAREENQTADFESILSRAVENAENNRDTSDIRNAAIEIESFFIYQMFQAMRRTVPEPEGLFERSNAEVIFTQMLDEEKAQVIAQSGGLGIADAVYRELTR